MLLPVLVALLLWQSNVVSSAVKDFAAWRSHQSADTGLFELMAKYREHLLKNGLSTTDIAAIFGELERDRWNRIYSGDAPLNFNSAPNTFLTEVVKGVRPGGRALDIGVGQGRNAIFLAKQGWDVTGFDIAEHGLEVTRQSAQAAGVSVKTVRASYSNFDFGVDEWDLIVGLYEGVTWHRSAVRGLKSGGILVIEGFLRGPGTPPGASFGPNELISLFASDLRILRYEESDAKPDFGPPGARVIRLHAQNPQRTGPDAAK